MDGCCWAVNPVTEGRAGSGIDGLGRHVACSGSMSERVDPHAGAGVLVAGVPLARARAVVFLLHGRGGRAERTLELARSLPQEDICYLAPAAAGNSWYPGRFLAPVEENEPALSSALQVLTREIARVEVAGVPRERVVLGGFSQGACLSLEWALRTGGRLGGVFALSGAVLGKPGGDRPFDHDLAGTRVYLACGDADRHIPLGSVKASGEILRRRGADVEERVFRGVGHIIVSQEIHAAARVIRQAAGLPEAGAGRVRNR